MLSNFLFSSSTCGFKRTKKSDLAIIYSSIPCTYAGVFTTNQIKASCIDENKRLLNRGKKIRALVINSGNANACTGKKGIQALKKTKQIVARLLKINADDVLVASTGVIGVHLDMEKMKNGIEAAIPKLNPKHLKRAAKAILTTDKFVKIKRKKTKYYSLIGFAKGAGMIHPNMATMLCFLMTDLKAPQNLLQEALKSAVNDTFNNISVDGDMSTNDMVILLSSNLSKKGVSSRNDPIYLSFKRVLYETCLKLAKEIVIDGEGAKKLITVKVLGARSIDQAKAIARSISSSTLFKCAVFGSDPNWGRVAARIGAAGVKVNQGKIDIFLNNTQVFKDGNPIEFSRKKLSRQISKQKELKVTLNLKSGNKRSLAFGCDLSYDYVRFNSAYFT